MYGGRIGRRECRIKKEGRRGGGRMERWEITKVGRNEVREGLNGGDSEGGKGWSKEGRRGVGRGRRF